MNPKQKLDALVALFDEMLREIQARERNIKQLSHEIRALVDASVDPSILSTEDLQRLKTSAEALYDGAEWASVGASCWSVSRPVSSLVFQRANHGVSLETQKTIAATKGTNSASSKTASTKVSAMGDLAKLSDEDKQTLLAFLRGGK